MKIYVATIDLRYEVMAAATTEAAARKAAAKKGMAFLREAGCAVPEKQWNTVAKMDDYYGIRVTAVELDGPAEFVGL